MNRREFTKLSAFALAWKSLPSLAQTAASQKPVGYAAIGLGTISDIFMRACANSQTAKVTALVTGHPDTKGVKYAAMYGIPKTSIYTYETFDRIRDNRDVDAVYVGLPNSMHCEYTVRGAQASKHVLCEKPMAISSGECRQMIDACRQAKVKLMIAYRVQYEPLWKQTIETIKSGGIGELESFQGGFYAQQPLGSWRLSSRLLKNNSPSTGACGRKKHARSGRAAESDLQLLIAGGAGAEGPSAARHPGHGGRGAGAVIAAV